MDEEFQSLVDEVVGAAEADSDNASEIYADAAERFRAAASMQRSDRVAGMLSTKADEFEIRSRDHKSAILDDFEETEKEHAQAHAEVGHLGDMEILARRNQIHDAKRFGDRISIAPRSVRQTTRLGNSAVVRFNPNDEDRALGIQATSTVILWQGEKPEAQTVTIDVGRYPGGSAGVTYPNALAPFDPAFPTGQPYGYRPYAELQYAVDGYLSEVIRFDIGRGQRITLAAHYVSVIVGMEAPLRVINASGDNVPQVPGSMRLGGSLGFFAASSVSPPMNTVALNLLPSGTPSPPIIIPPRASFLLPIQSSGLGDTVDVVIQDVQGFPVGHYSFTAGVPVVNPIPLGNDAYQIVVTNTGHAANLRIPFQLAL